MPKTCLFSLFQFCRKGRTVGYLAQMTRELTQIIEREEHCEYPTGISEQNNRSIALFSLW